MRRVWARSLAMGVVVAGGLHALPPLAQTPKVQPTLGRAGSERPPVATLVWHG